MDEYIDFDAKSFPEYFLNALKLVNEIDGDFVECGFGHGNSCNIAISGMQNGELKKRHVVVADSFKGFPKPSIEDKSTRKTKKGEWAIPITNAEKIKESYQDMEILEGFFDQTLHNYQGTIAILHLDCDLYNSYKCCLTTLYNKVISGGIILFDEYKGYTQFKNFPGASKAIDEFLQDKDIQFHRCKYFQKPKGGMKPDKEYWKEKVFIIKP